VKARARALVQGASALTALALVQIGAAAADGAMHLGVASCATGVCHGKIVAQSDSNVALNEYRIWSSEDRHARAYLTLGSPQSKVIADNLGLGSAQTAEVCLDCHADNVPQAQRGPKFQISDGVGCEACHGGSERWIESHTDPGVAHADNVAEGMFPTEIPRRRAELCLDCHMGDEERYATHAIMGAGHPRLSFELDAFSTNQPAHFDIDDDYVRRKGAVEGFDLWLAGQLVGAQRQLSLQSSHWLDSPGGLFPELGLYDCQGCHHAMDDVRWSKQAVGPGIGPGTVRLNDDHLVVLRAALAVIDPGVRAEFAQRIQRLIQSGQQSAEATRRSARELNGWLGDRAGSWQSRAYDRDSIAAIRRAIVADAAEGRLVDYGAAEQVYLAVDSLSLMLGDDARLRRSVDALFESVESDQTYRPDHFARAARALLGAL